MRPELFRYLIFKAEELLKLSCQLVQSGIFGFGMILLLFEQKGLANPQEIRPDELPPKRATLTGIPWLPRIIKKATCFLEGALCHDIMYGCGGDRHFLREHRLHPADFLQAVWLADGDDQKILSFMRDWETAGLDHN